MVRAMPARQLWAFLTDADLGELIERIGAREPGLAVSQGRYLRGDPEALLRDPTSLERRESLPGDGGSTCSTANIARRSSRTLQPAVTRAFERGRSRSSASGRRADTDPATPRARLPSADPLDQLPQVRVGQERPELSRRHRAHHRTERLTR